jgi:hypothetical protein
MAEATRPNIFDRTEDSEVTKPHAPGQTATHLNHYRIGAVLLVNFKIPYPVDLGHFER